MIGSANLDSKRQNYKTEISRWPSLSKERIDRIGTKMSLNSTPVVSSWRRIYDTKLCRENPIVATAEDTQKSRQYDSRYAQEARVNRERS